LSDKYTVILTFSEFMVDFAHRMKQQKAKEESCFTFELSIRVSKPKFEENEYFTDTDPEENELVRIDWEGHVNGESTNTSTVPLLDPSKKLIVYLEFKESL